METARRWTTFNEATDFKIFREVSTAKSSIFLIGATISVKSGTKYTLLDSLKDI